MAESGPSVGVALVSRVFSVYPPTNALHQTGTSEGSQTMGDSQTAIWLLGVACSRQTRTRLGPHRQVASCPFTSLT